MSVSTDGHICLGIIFPGNEFPWEDHLDEEEWWREEVHGVKLETWGERHAWNKEHPIPIEIVNYCSGEYPMYMIAVKGTLISCNRGYPEVFDPLKLVPNLEQVQAFREFVDKYLKAAIDEHNNDEYTKAEDKIDLTPKWYLTSYWG